MKLQGIENTPMLLADTPKQPILSDVRASERGHEHFDRQNLKFQVEIFFYHEPALQQARTQLFQRGGGGGGVHFKLERTSCQQSSKYNIYCSV